MLNGSMATGAVDVETDDDDFVTSTSGLARCSARTTTTLTSTGSSRCAPGGWIAVDGDEITVDGDHWLCVFPRAPHAVVHVSDDCEVLSLFVPSATMETAFGLLALPPAIGRAAILGGEPTIAHGLALAWGEQRFARRRGDPFDEALGLYVAAGCAALRGTRRRRSGMRLRAAFGSDGSTIATFFEHHLADQPFRGRRSRSYSALRRARCSAGSWRASAARHRRHFISAARSRA